MQRTCSCIDSTSAAAAQVVCHGDLRGASSVALALTSTHLRLQCELTCGGRLPRTCVGGSKCSGLASALAVRRSCAAGTRM